MDENGYWHADAVISDLLICIVCVSELICCEWFETKIFMIFSLETVVFSFGFLDQWSQMLDFTKNKGCDCYCCELFILFENIDCHIDIK